jgi:hypothetical protein
MVVGLPAIVPSNHLTLESSLPTQSIERLFTIAQWFALLIHILMIKATQQAKNGSECHNWRNILINTQNR